MCVHAFACTDVHRHAKIFFDETQLIGTTNREQRQRNAQRFADRVVAYSWMQKTKPCMSRSYLLEYLLALSTSPTAMTNGRHATARSNGRKKGGSSCNYTLYSLARPDHSKMRGGSARGETLMNSANFVFKKHKRSLPEESRAVDLPRPSVPFRDTIFFGIFPPQIIFQKMLAINF
jgi:hypothetical protein